jgi:hypothetical protein
MLIDEPDAVVNTITCCPVPNPFQQGVSYIGNLKICVPVLPSISLGDPNFGVTMSETFDVPFSIAASTNRQVNWG